RALILREYSSDIDALSDRLSSSRRQNAVSPELLSRLVHYERTIPGVHLAWGPHNRAEIYRRFLSYVFHRLQQSRESTNAPAAYHSAAEFEGDIALIRSSLQAKVIAELGPTLSGPVESAEARELLETFRTIAQLKRTHPAGSIRHYIIS